MKETMDCIETYEEFESPEISDGEAQNTPIFTNTEQERSFAKNDLLKNITEEKLSDIVSTPEREKFGNPKNYSTEMVRIESSEQRSNKSIDLNNLVTKVNIGLPFVPNKKDE
mmetsp:Transcript_25359/g.25092  ORF Transcript_25359/g.25092 Transcript_25359/m.25092 type:complete len:112 (-) Transcript_25359:819-1154(-)